MKDIAEAATREALLERVRALAERVVAVWPLDRPVVKLLHPKKNVTFQVEETGGAGDGRRYVLRVCDPDGYGEAEILSELEYLLALHRATGLVVPAPVRACDGSLVVRAESEGLERPRWCALFRWVPGRMVADAPTPQYLERVGEISGKLHRFAEEWQPPAGFSRPRWDADGLFGRGPVLAPGQGAPLVGERSREMLEEAAAAVRETMAGLGEGPDVFGLIHKDLEPDNTVVESLADGDRVHPIDFADLGWGHYLYDIAAALLPLREKAGFAAMREAFLCGYRRIRPLSAEHADLLETFFIARGLFSVRLMTGKLWDMPHIREYAETAVPQILGGVRAFLEKRRAGSTRTTVQLLAALRERGIKLWADGESLEKLKYNAPPGALTAELLAEIKDRKTELLAFLRQGHVARRSGAPAQIAAAHRERPSLSFAQQRLWLLHQLFPQSVEYNIARAVRLQGTVRIDLLTASLQAIVRRHGALRTTFAVDAGDDGEPVQVVAPELSVPLPLVDLTALPAERREAEAWRLAQADARRPFDLARGPLLRVFLLRLDGESFIAPSTMHHTIGDGWSSGILFREMGLVYGALARGEKPALPALPVQYVDYAVWQRQWLTGEVLAEQLAYWKEQLAGAPQELDLPTDRPRSGSVGNRGDRRGLLIPQPLAERLRAFSQAQGATLFMILLAGFQALLSRWSGQEDIVVGSPIANRNRTEIEGLIGCFVNTLVLRTDLTGDPAFRNVLAAVRRTTLGAYAHQDLPFEKIVEELRPERSLTSSPLFQVIFTLQNVPSPDMEAAGFRMNLMPPTSRAAMFDLACNMKEMPEGVRTSFMFKEDLFDGATVERLADHYLRLLEAVAGDPDLRLQELPLLSDAETRQILEWGGVRAEPEVAPQETLASLFEAQARRSPEARAVTCGSAELTYGDLDRRAGRLAERLRDLGVGPESRVGLRAERSLELIVGMLAIVKAGGAYVPLDPRYPSERLAYLMEDAGVRVVVEALTGQEEALWIVGPGERVEGSSPLGGGGLEQGGGQEGGAESHRNRLFPKALPDGGAPLLTSPLSQPPPSQGGGTTADNAAYVIYTSGSTGQPKGVVVTHANVIRLLRATEPWFGFGPDDVWTLFHSYAFDFSVWEIWGALLTGGRLVVVPWETSRSPDAFHQLLAAERVTVLNQTPTAFAELMRVDARPESAALDDLRLVIFGGEALVPARLAGWLDRYGDAQPRLVNMYGITETTVHVTFRPIERSDAREGQASVIGTPIPDLSVHVLDRGGRSAPVGVPGELAIGGAGLARGYLGRPERTAERFVPDPFAKGRGGARLYRSGDLGRFRNDGELEYLGRIDHQVKIRGFRIEPGEIEAALLALPGVREAVVLARRDEAGGGRLVAFFVPNLSDTEPGPSPFELRRLLAAKLPEHQVPAVLIALDALPRTANGKVDRKALLARDDASAATPGTDDGFVAPRTPAEELIAGIFAEVLKVEAVGAESSFFDLGGHSLLATQVVSRVRRALGVELPLRVLFETPTVAALAAWVSAALAPGDRETWAAIPRRDPSVAPPLSFAQERLWFLDQWAPGTALYNIPGVLELSGSLDVPALRAAFAGVVRRHESLRTVFRATSGQPSQHVLPPFSPELPVIDLAALPEAARAIEAERLRREEAGGGFDLAAGPLFRARLLRLAPLVHHLLLTFHHIVFDGSSTGVLARDLAALYAAARDRRPSPLPEPAIQYPDFAAWQRSWLSGDTLERFAGYWRRRLSGVAPLRLPLDRPRPPAQSFTGDVVPLALAPEVAEAVRRTARREGATPFMVGLAAFAALLHRASGQRDFAVGTWVANRTRPEVEGLIGFFVNNLALRLSFDEPPPFSGWLAQVRETALGAYAHQDLPFEKMIEDLKLPRDLSMPPVFQVACVQQPPAGRLELAGLRLELLTGAGARAHFDLTLDLGDGSGAASLVYNRELFDRATAVRFGDQFARLLGAAVEEAEGVIDELPLLSPAEVWQIAGEWSRGLPRPAAERVPGVRFAHQLIERWAALRPDAEAVIYPGGPGEPAERLTYGELNARANRLARCLRRRGAGPEVRVAIRLPRGTDLLVCTLAVLKAGGCYLPLDAAYSGERLEYMAADAQAKVLLTRGEPDGGMGDLAGLTVLRLEDPTLPAELAAASEADLSPEETGLDPANLAYVIYTSGSTGRPKGTVIAHRSLLDAFYGWQQAYRLGETTAHLQMASFSFDVFTEDMLRALGSGARLVLCPREVLLDPARLYELMRAERIDAAELVPAVARSLAEHLERTGGRLDFFRLLLVGADAWYAGEAAALARLCGPRTRVVDTYGVTEATIDNTFLPLAAGDGTPAHTLPPAVAVVPIGRPLAGQEAWILGRAFDPVPARMLGELCLGGAGLARGYLDRPALTAEKFVPHPLATDPGERLYRTGDLARWLPDGTIEFLGRADSQIKVRGFRIEPGEIEAVLSAHPRVSRAVVTALDSAPGRRQLVAYVVVGPHPRPSPSSPLPPPGEGRQEEAEGDRAGVSSPLGGGGLEQGGGQEGGVASGHHLSASEVEVVPKGGAPLLTSPLSQPPPPQGGGTGREEAFAFLPSPGDREGGAGRGAGGEGLAADLRAFLKDRLPDYMVPAVFVPLAELPLSPNGKVDRRALPVPDWEGALDRADRSGRAPRTAVEEALAGIWREVLGVSAVGAGDDFFASGGHSLLATQVVSRVRQALGVELPLRSLFTHPVLADLAREIEGLRRAGDGAALPPVVRVAHDAAAPLSFAQERLWFLHRFAPESDAYNIALSLRLEGGLRREVAARALGEIVRRHEVLRTVIAEADGVPVQVVGPTPGTLLPLCDLSGLPVERRGPEARRLAAATARRPFDLAHGPVLRALLVRLAEREHTATLAVHHIATDGWSTAILVREFSTLYAAFAAGAPSPLPELPVQYADYAVWQRRRLAGPVLDRHLAWWREKLGVDPPPLDLPTDRPRLRDRAWGGAVTFFTLAPELAAALNGFSRKRSVSLFMTLLAAWKALLGRLSGQAVIRVGTPVANRPGVEVEDLIGFFLNTLVLATDVASGSPSFQELLDRVRETSLDAQAHQDAPFDRLVEDLVRERDLSLSPLFQVLFVLQNMPGARADLPDLRLAQLPAEARAANFDLALQMEEGSAGLTARLDYSTDLFDAATVDRLACHFQTLLTAAAAAPETLVTELPLLTGAERAQLLATGTGPDVLGAGETPAAIFAAQARRAPGDPAVTCDGRSLTYGELNARANQLAHFLRRLGVEPEVGIGLCAERSLDLVVGLLGILKAGGAYVPLDPTYPRERLAYLIEDAGVQVLVGTERALAGVPAPADGILLRLDGRERGEIESCPAADPPPIAEAENIAYVIYTSGSTGRPKGVLVTQGSVAAYARWSAAAYEVARHAGSCVHTSLSFDLTVTSLLTPLLAGAPVHLLPERAELDGLARAVAATGYGFVKLTPAHLELLRGETAAFAAADPLTLVVGGEALHGGALRGWPERARVFNEYGPTEATVGCCVYRVPAGWEGPLPIEIPIGRPIAGARLSVLDGGMEIMPVGVPGELWIGGAGLARGYLGRPDLSAERFRPDPHGPAGARLYRTGDRARWRTDGELEYLGRLDEQVKIRGYRIEPGEIEAVLAEHPEIEQAAVLVRSARLVAYVTGTADAEGLRGYLGGRLPEHLVPADFVRLDALPLTANGKVDRKALLALGEPSQPSSAVEGRFAAPRDRTEELLAEVWLQVLGAQRTGGRISVHDSFFQLGGDSILSLQVVSRAAKAGLRITPRQLFERQTIAQLAAVAVPLAAAVPRRDEAADGPVPLTPIQERFFAAALPHSERYNQAVLLAARETLEPERLRRAIAHLWRRHEALRLRFSTESVEEAPQWVERSTHWVEHRTGPVEISTGSGERPTEPGERPTGSMPSSTELGERPTGWGERSTGSVETSTGSMERSPEGGASPRAQPWAKSARAFGPTAPHDPPGLLHIDLSALPELSRPSAQEEAADALQASFDLGQGPLLRVALFRSGDQGEDRLLVILHHLVVDGVSWRILVEDLEDAYRQLERGESVALPPPTTSFRQWAERLREYARSPEAAAQARWWVDRLPREVPSLPVDAPHPPTPSPTPSPQPGEGEKNGASAAGVGRTAAPLSRGLGGDGRGDGGEGTSANTVASMRSVEIGLTAEETRALLDEAPRAYRTQVNDLLLAALVEAFAPWTGSRRLLLDLEGHGREDLFADVDLSRTVGWLTSVFPVALDLTGTESPGEALKAAKEQLRAVPGRGLGFGVVRWLGDGEVAAALRRLPVPEVAFNYLGQFTAGEAEERLLRPASGPTGATHHGGQPRAYLLEIHGGVTAGRLWMQIGYSVDHHRAATIERLAERFAEGLRRLVACCLEPGAGGVTPSDFPLAGLDAAALDRLAATVDGPLEDLYPLSPIQQGLLFHALHAPESGAYVVQVSAGFGEGLDVTAFERSWQQVADRYPLLRTAFRWLGLDEPLQAVHARLPLVWERQDWRGLSPEEEAARLEDYLRADRRRGFDLAAAPLMRLALFRVGPADGRIGANSEASHPEGEFRAGRIWGQERSARPDPSARPSRQDDSLGSGDNIPSTAAYRFVWTHHHAILDGWSQPILLRELFTCYAAARQGTAPRLEPVRPYRDYIAWLRQQDLGAAETFWRDELAGFTAPTPLGGSVAAGAPSLPHGREHIALPGPVSEALDGFARRHQLTLNTLLQGAWSVLLARGSGESDVVFGGVTAGRGAPLPGIERMVGLFINTLPVRARISERMPAVSWLRRLQERQAAARQLEYTPLPRVQAWSEVPAGTPLFESILSFDNYPLDEALREDAGTALAIGGSEGMEQAHYPLNLIVVPGARLSVQLLHERPRFDAVTAERLLGHLANLLTGMASLPFAETPLAALPLLSAAEQAQLLEWGSGPAEPGRGETLAERFEAQARRSPGALAVRCESGSLTYGELNARANRLAHFLRGLGVEPEVGIGLCAERSLDLVVGLLGILKSGGAYVPLDPTYPRDRLAFLVEDAGLQVLVGTEHALASLPAPADAIVLRLDGAEQAEIESCPADDPPPIATAQNIAYVIYTSGSTGRPKGVLVTQGSVEQYVRWSAAAYEVERHAGSCVHTSLSFDLTVTSLLTPLLAGVPVHLLPEKADLDGLAQALASTGYGFVKLTPAHLELLRGETAAFAAAEPLTLVVGGEALHGAALRGWPERARIFNEYGPTEATVGCCVYRVPAGWAGGEGPVPIGRPIAEARLHVLDGEAAAVPVGAPGELWIGGAGLARGYLGRPERTAERFLPDPYGEPGARLYRTGDRARWRPDGLLEYLGRLDEQVKVRGYRIEPGEVEAALAEHPEIERAAVVARPDPDGQKRLVAYVVGQVETEALRQHLAARLPEPLIPAAFVRLDALPLTSNGKVDRRALLSLDEPSRSPSSIEDRFVAPRDRTEELLAEVWLQVLGEPRTGGRIGVHDSFFELGGDSILSLQVVSRAAKVGLRLTPRQLFERRTIAELAPVVVPLATAPQRGPETVSGPVPLTPIQKRFFAAALPHSEHYNQSVLLAPVTKPFEPERLRLAITALWVQHDALRLRFPDPHPHPLSHPHSPRPGEGRHRPEEEKVGVSVAFPPLPGGRECGWERGPGGEGPQQICAPSDTPPGLLQIDLSALPEPLRLTASEAAAGVLQASFDLSRGPLLRAALLSTGDPRGDRLLVILHHLVVDGVSWRILVQDLEEACRQLERGERIALPPKTTSFQSWAEHLREHARSAAAVKEAEWWLEHVRPVERRLPVEAPMGGGNTVASLRSAGLALTAEETRALLEEAPRAYRTQINDLLLAALVEAFAPWTGSRRLLIDLEGHGREDLFPDVDLSRTVGWLTSVFPVALDLTGSEAPGEAIKAVKEQLRAVPGRGVGFGIVRWLGDGETAERLRRLPVPEVSFNYLGQIAAGPEEERRFRLAGEPMGDTDFRGQPRAYLLEVHGGVADGRLRMQIGYSADLHRAATVEALAERYAAALRRLIQHCLEPGAGGVTPSDFPLADLDAPALARITAAMSGPSGPIEDLYPLSPLQQGMLFHALHAPGSGDYVVQMSVGFGADLDVAAFERSWQQVVDRHAVLRTSFYWLGLDEPLQRVHARLPLVWERRDWRGLPTAEQAERVADYLRAERERGFHPGTAPLLRLALLHLDAEDGTAYRFVWTHHHAILDGWSLPILLRELFTCYAAARQGTAARLPPVRSYRDYIAWLRQQDLGVAEAFWRAELAGFRTPTPLPGAAAEAGLEEERVQSRRQTVLPGEVSDALRAFARRHQLTLNTVLQGAWALLLARSGGADDVVFGAVTAGRGAPIPGIESMVGLFVNTLPVRVRIPRRLPAAPWLGRLQERQAAARQFEHTPLARVQSWSEVPAGEALFASILSFGNYPVDEALREDAGTALTIGGVEGIEQTHYPLAVDVLPGRDLGVQILYEEPRLDGVAVERILGHFANLLTAIAADAANTAADRPAAELPMLSPVEEAQLLAAGVAAERPEETRTLVERFAQRAARTPWQAALTFGGVRLTWAELDERSSALAAYLRRQGIGPEARVGLAIEPSLERVVGLLGILKAGGAVVPVDPAAPGDWLRQVLAAAGAALCLTAERWRPVVGALVEKVLCLDRDWPLVMSGGRGVRAAGGVGLESLACVSYAAAHGRPLGLMVSQRGLFSEEAVREDFAVLLKILAGPGPHPGPSPRALPWAQSGRAFGPQDADGVYLLDRRQQWVPVGSPGEVCVGGAGLARGWLGRPELTAETFVPHPWSAEPGARLFRTGRWARRRADGTIELLGARDSCEVVE